MAAQTRQELGVANVEHSRRLSACDALQTATTAVVAMMYKLQIRSAELIDEFFNLAEQLVENTRRFVAAGVVLQCVLTSGLTSSDEQRREDIVSAINAEMEKRSPAGRHPQVSYESLATVDCRRVAERLRALAELLSLPT